MIFAAVAASLLVLSVAQFSSAEQVDVEAHAAKLRSVGLKGEGHAEASKAWQAIAKADADQLTAILATTGTQHLGVLLALCSVREAAV